MVWSVRYTTKSMHLTLPTVKITKGQFLLNDHNFDHGCKTIPYKLVQQLRGNQNFWEIVMPVLEALVGPTNNLLRYERTMPPVYATPKGSEEKVEATWEDFWDSIEIQSLLADDPARWVNNFSSGVEEALSPMERLSLPGASERVVFVTGDSTIERVATIDWRSKWLMRETLAPFLAALKELAGGEEDDMIVAISELLTLVAFAAKAAKGWTGCIIINGGDNQNVQRWLARKDILNRDARHLSLILVVMEASYHFRVVAAYFRTCHNSTADAFTRLMEEDMLKLEKEHGLVQIDVTEAWTAHLNRGWIRRALVWEGQHADVTQKAIQLSNIRVAQQQKIVKPLLTLGANLKVVEWRASLGCYARAAIRMGASVWMQPCTGGPTTQSKLWPARVKITSQEKWFAGADMACIFPRAVRSRLLPSFKSSQRGCELGSVTLDVPCRPQTGEMCWPPATLEVVLRESDKNLKRDSGGSSQGGRKGLTLLRRKVKNRGKRRSKHLRRRFMKLTAP